MDIDYFLKINNTYGAKNRKEVQLYNLRNHVNDRFTDTIDWYEVKVNELDRELLVIRTVAQDEKNIKSRPNETFEVGDYVSFDNNIWLIISKDMCDQVYTTGTIKLCNFTINFQSPDGTILSYPCYTSNKTSGTGENNGEVIDLGNSRRIVLVPYDENTILLRNDDRFFLDKHPTKPTPFKITECDTTTYSFGNKGLIQFKVEQDVLNEKDRPDLGICDYFNPKNPPIPTPPSSVNCKIFSTRPNFDGKTKLGVTYTFVTEFTDDTGTILTNIIPNYTVNSTFYDVISFVVNSDNSVSITVNEDKGINHTNETFELICEDTAVGYSEKLELTVINKY